MNEYMKEFGIKVDMPPFAKARPRVTKNGTYMPPKYIAKRDTLRVLYMAEGGELDVRGLLKLSVLFRFKMPASWPDKKRAVTAGNFCPKRPDLDNLVGAVMDALLIDDSKVVELGRCRKIWGYFDAIYISIEEIDND